MKKIKFLTSSIDIDGDTINFHTDPHPIRYLGVVIAPIMMFIMLKDNFLPFPILETLLFSMFLVIFIQVLYYQTNTLKINDSILMSESKLEPFGIVLKKQEKPVRTSIIFIDYPLSKSNNTLSWAFRVKGFVRDFTLFETLSKTEVKKIEQFFESNQIRFEHIPS
jgi:hypothetical protein